MKQAVFNALTVVEASGIAALPVGTYFLLDVATGGLPATTGESKQLTTVDLRHKITYHQRIAGDGSLAGQGSLIYRRVLDILESDDLADQNKTGTRPGLNRAPARDDDDRLRYKETDWS